MRSPKQSPVELKQSLRLWQLVASGVGIVVGAGIYVLVGQAAADAGGLLWVSFLVSGALAALTGLSYAELAALFPRAGAEYEFARQAFGESIGFMAGWMMVGALLVGAAAVAVGFAHYVQWFVDVDLRVAAIGLIVALTLLVIAGLERSIWLSVALVAVQVGGLLVVIVAGAPHLGDESLREGAGIGGVMSAAALVFFAFIGFDEVVTLSEETRDPARSVPRALLLTLGISTLLYIAVGVVAVSAVGADALGRSDQPLGLVMEQDIGSRAGDVIAAIALASTTNTTLLVLTAGARMIFSMARGNVLPPVFALLTPGARTPWLAALAGAAVAIPFTLSGRIELIAQVTNFAIYVLFVGVNLAVIRLRQRRPDLPRRFRAPFEVRSVPLTAALGVVTSVFLLFYIERAAWVLGLLMVASGVAAWLASPYLGRRGAGPMTDE
ncbi:MAG: APC family permease [Dehalococcoidia bacterium]